MRRAAKKDACHDPIVADALRLGFAVVETYQVGGGAPDAFIYSPYRQGWIPFEFKSDNTISKQGERLQPKQRSFTGAGRKRDYPDLVFPPIYVASTIEHVLAVVAPPRE